MFNIVNTETGEIIHSFDDGATAGRFVAERNSVFAGANMTVRYRIVRQNMTSDEWMARESDRFANGIYRFVPWHDEPWNNRDHFCHVSNDDGGKLAYTATAEDGERDRQTRTRPGRYLTQYYSEVLSQDDIREWCAKFDMENGKRKLLFATTPDEIEQVYTNGPSSCMAHGIDYYNSPIHPVRVYGSGDFACAYIMGTDGDISARVIVAPKRKVYGRIYGDFNRVRLLLEEEGYTRSEDQEDWDGLRLLRVPHRDSFVAPYLDPPMSNVRDNGSYLVIDCDGEIECNETSGLTHESCYCSRCEDSCGETYTVGNEQWCQNCYESYSTYCVGCSNHFDYDDIVGTDRHDNSYCTDCASDMSICDCCNHLHEDTVETLENETYCEYCAEDELEQTKCETWAREPTNCDCEVCTNQGEEA